MDAKSYDRRKKRFWLQTAVWYVFLALMTYYFSEFMLFYLLCGIYDVSRNSNIDMRILQRYFLGNGVPTWALSPFNILMDLLTLPYINKKIYQLHDLPADCQQEIEHILAAAKSENLVDQLANRVENVKRGMLFFKWYGINLQNSVSVPAFHQDYKYIKTIGVSVFNKKESTDEHFGPLRATLRVLYNINDVKDSASYIKVRKRENHWCDNKLFIFDDTLSHQSFNQTDAPRYCLFVDIVRPSRCHSVLDKVVDLLGDILQKSKFIFYGSWVPLR
ncbi:aspartyl/asparaginyl beta-hydroxylase domain-containing protein [Methylomicrobium lacus]|uniref:aspartyl/asparaginyl beta-hydroxylase domain-containing protein n=1 Tax=Methylomicrobium lacus TaxID=136992 RepID=UPI00045E99FF|nr:aspartyl/asparaginyl beta-hydroxylase domain-containing protein [Methylomicrobium lacus]